MVAVVITMLDISLPPGEELNLARVLQRVCDATRARPGCLAAGVYQQVGCPGETLYVEAWAEAASLEDHIRSPGFDRLLAVVETSPVPPSLTFRFVSETRDLAWVEQLRMDAST